jgi:hypothetical protein
VVGLVAEVGARGRLDAISAVAEVDRVQVLREDLVLGPLAREVVGQGGLAHLLKDRAVALGAQGVLDELLGDGRSALRRLAAEHVLHEGAADASHVDARVLVEAAILDGDDRVGHVRREVPVAHEHAALVVGQDAEGPPLGVRERRVARVLILLAVLEVRQVGRDGHHHPEQRRDDGEDAQRQEDGQQPALLDGVTCRCGVVATRRRRASRRRSTLALARDGNPR